MTEGSAARRLRSGDGSAAVVERHLKLVLVAPLRLAFPPRRRQSSQTTVKPPEYRGKPLETGFGAPGTIGLRGVESCPWPGSQPVPCAGMPRNGVCGRLETVRPGLSGCALSLRGTRLTAPACGDAVREFQCGDLAHAARSGRHSGASMPSAAGPTTSATRWVTRPVRVSCLRGGGASSRDVCGGSAAPGHDGPGRDRRRVHDSDRAL